MIIRNFGLRQGRQALAAPRFLLQASAFHTSECTAFYNSRLNRAEVAQAPDSPAQVTRLLARDEKAAEARARKAAVAKIPAQHKKFKKLQKDTQSLGANVELTYLPDEVLKNPPHDVTLEDLMAAQAHMGHNTSLWNPANARYIYGVRDGIHIISLETIAAHVRRAARVVEEVAYRGGLILFVGTRPGQMPIVVRAAELAGACHLFQKWTPGTITNRDQMLIAGELQVVDERDRPLPGFENHLSDRRPVVPDLVVCLNPMENYTVLYECGLANIPTIGIIDTNANPTWVTYQIPANDDSVRAVSLIAGVLGRAGQRGQARRHEAASEGSVTWQNPIEIEKFIYRDALEKAEAKNKANQTW